MRHTLRQRVPRDCARSGVCPLAARRPTPRRCPAPRPTYCQFSSSSSPGTCSFFCPLYLPSPRLARWILQPLGKLKKRKKRGYIHWWRIRFCTRLVPQLISILKYLFTNNYLSVKLSFLFYVKMWKYLYRLCSQLYTRMFCTYRRILIQYQEGLVYWNLRNWNDFNHRSWC